MLSRPGAFDGLRIHTDCLGDVLDGFALSSLNHAVVCERESLA